MKDDLVILNNAKNTPIKIIWAFNQNGDIKEKIIVLPERAIGYEVGFVNGDDKKNFFDTIQYLIDEGKIIISKKVSDKQMEKESEKAKKESGKATKEVHSELDKQIEDGAEMATNGDVKGFKVETKKAKK